MTETFVLDSFAVLALLGREPGSDEIAGLLRQSQEGETHLLMTWVNLGEVAYIVERRWGTERMHAALAMLEATSLELVPVGRQLALAAAHIKAKHAVAYADAFAAALSQHISAKLVTGDPEFELLEDIVDVHWLPQRTQ